MIKKAAQYGIIGLVILVAGFIYQHPHFWDVSFNKTNSLSQSSLDLISHIQKPLNIELFTENTELKDKVYTLITRFQKENAFVQFKDQKSLLPLRSESYLRLSYDEHVKTMELDVSKWNEQTLSNFIFQTIRNKTQWVVFLSGHGEPDPFAEENRGTSQLSDQLKSKGLKIISLNLNAIGAIPDNTQTLVLNEAKTPLLPQERQKILDYIEQGGHLLWLIPPNAPFDAALADALGIDATNGTIQDQQAMKLGALTPEITIITEYPTHPITEKLDLVTIFPWSRSLQYTNAEAQGWQSSPFLITHADTALKEQGKTIVGPFAVGVSLTKGPQRIVVIGNNHFLSNGAIHNYGNLSLASRIFNWLNDMDFLLNITYQPPIDALFTNTASMQIIIQYVFPYALPLLYLLLSWQIKRSRDKRSFCV